MPNQSTIQTQMDLFLGKAPNVDANGVIDNISYKRNVVAKVADYTAKASESGTLFTSEGATADIEFTLPALADGLEFIFFNAEDIEMVVSSAADNTMVASGDAAAGHITFTTATVQIGCGVTVICDGSKWMCLMHIGNSGSLPAPVAVT